MAFVHKMFLSFDCHSQGLFARRRMFLLTEGPRLFYVDAANMVLKGEIPWLVLQCLMQCNHCIVDIFLNVVSKNKCCVNLVVYAFKIISFGVFFCICQNAW